MYKIVCPMWKSWQLVPNSRTGENPGCEIRSGCVYWLNFTRSDAGMPFTSPGTTFAEEGSKAWLAFLAAWWSSENRQIICSSFGYNKGLNSVTSNVIIYLILPLGQTVCRLSRAEAIVRLGSMDVPDVTKGQENLLEVCANRKRVAGPT